MTPHMTVLSRASADLRIAKKNAKHQIRTGEMSIVDVMLEPPDGLKTTMIPDVLMCVPGFGREKLRVMGRRALIAKVNLLVPLGDAPQWTREFVAKQMAARS